MDFPPEFQIVSDLHLETPFVRSQYSTFKLEPHVRYLCLLGDIGLVKDDGLFQFLESCLEKTPNLHIFYVFGNHEAYQLSMANAIARMRHFVDRVNWKYGDRIFLLDRTRHNISSRVTILGCTLWSNILPDERHSVRLLLTDFHGDRGIQGWTFDDHMEAHRRDLEWLNSEVEKIKQEEPDRQIAILTHHSPTKDIRASSERHLNSGVNSAFATDLSSEPCWTSPQVKLWAFGHTHRNFRAFVDEPTGKIVYANQKGYAKGNRAGWDPDRFIEAGEEKWIVREVLLEEGQEERSTIPEVAHQPQANAAKKELGKGANKMLWKRLKSRFSKGEKSGGL